MFRSLFATCSHSFYFLTISASTEIYTLSLHDALPICRDPVADSFPAQGHYRIHAHGAQGGDQTSEHGGHRQDRKSTRLNSSHSQISYAVFCLKKKKNSYRLSVSVTYLTHGSSCSISTT